MNILPKKRWHVRNKDNVARVRRDEQRAKEDAEKAERRRNLAEQEAKVDQLRQKLQDKKGEDKSFHEKHFNFFTEPEQESKAAVKSNKEYEKEKKTEQEEFEKKIGLLTYLGQSVTKEKGPWYLKQEKFEKANADVSVDQIDERKKLKLDPMQDVKKYLKEKSKYKEKDKKKRKKRRHQEITVAKEVSSKQTIEELRAKRLQREKEERRRTENLLGGVESKCHRETEDKHDPNRYSSQFNPDFFARKRK